MLQEWMFSSLAAGGGPEALVQPAQVQQTISNVVGPISFDVKDEQIIIADSTAGTVRMVLPPTVGQDGRLIVIKRISTGSQVQIGANAGDLIEGLASLILTAQNRFVQLVANEKLKAWHVIAQ
jgi:hypothetical protein